MIWKDIQGYEGLYAVSSDGDVMSVKKDKLLKQNISRTSHGYLRVRLSRGGIVKNYLVHGLVAIAFIPNPKKLAFVNHMDLTKTNNISDNLEWMTHQENITHAKKARKTGLWFSNTYNHLRK